MLWRESALGTCQVWGVKMDFEGSDFAIVCYNIAKIAQFTHLSIVMAMTVDSTPFQDVLERIEQLSISDQEALIEIVQKRLIELRRQEIAENARATVQAFREGRASYGTVDDLRRELEEFEE